MTWLATRRFPASTTVAFYDSFVPYIELATVHRADLEKALANDLSATRDCLSLFAHEMQHWTDHLSTLWGRRRLLASFEAMSAREANRENEFWRIVAYRRLRESDFFADYYHVVESETPCSGNRRPWRLQLSMGQRFDAAGKLDPARPVAFARFAWPDGTPACRVPYSASALLECRAIAAEAQVGRDTAASLEGNAQASAFARLQDSLGQVLYSAGLGAYSAAVHVVANALGLTDVMRALEFSSALAHLCLDLPSGFYQRIAVPDQFADWGDRPKKALAQKDLGVAFLCLMEHGSGSAALAPAEWLADICSKAGLPDPEALRREASLEADSLKSAAVVESQELQAQLECLWVTSDELRAGMEYPGNVRDLGLTDIKRPGVVCSGCEWFVPTHDSSVRTPAEMEARWKSRNSLTERFKEFTAACGI